MDKTNCNLNYWLRGAALAAAMAFGLAAQAQTTVTVNGSVYGGGALADVSTNTEVHILGGHVEKDVYGGGMGDATHAPIVGGNATVNIGKADDGTETLTTAVGAEYYNTVVIDGNVFGANNVAGTPKGDVKVNIYHTKHTAANMVPSLDEETTAALVAAPHAKENFALQGVYGGGNEADYTPDAAGKSAEVYVYYCDNTIKMLYGGGRAAAVGTTSVNANTLVTVDGGRVDTLFAGGDGHTTTDGLPKSGSNAYRPADIYGDAQGIINGGYFGAVFAGSNTSGTITGTMGVTIGKTPTCSQEELIGSFFGGGNVADIGSDASPTVISNTIECGAGYFETLFGGANNASIGTEAQYNSSSTNKSQVTLTINGGTFGQLFGGNNQGGTVWGDVNVVIHGGTIRELFGGSNQGGDIKGKINILIDSTVCDCGVDLETVYGAGNECAYAPVAPADGVSAEEKAAWARQTPFVVLRRGTVKRQVFGGGKGSETTLADPAVKVQANPVVVIGTAEVTDLPADVGTVDGLAFGYGDVFGGGNRMPVDGSTTIIIDGAKTRVFHNVYGAGNRAKVSGDTDVRIGHNTDQDDANAIAVPARITKHYGTPTSCTP